MRLTSSEQRYLDEGGTLDPALCDPDDRETVESIIKKQGAAKIQALSAKLGDASLTPAEPVRGAVQPGLVSRCIAAARQPQNAAQRVAAAADFIWGTQAMLPRLWGLYGKFYNCFRSVEQMCYFLLDKTTHQFQKNPIEELLPLALTISGIKTKEEIARERAAFDTQIEDAYQRRMHRWLERGPGIPPAWPTWMNTSQYDALKEQWAADIAEWRRRGHKLPEET